MIHNANKKALSSSNFLQLLCSLLAACNPSGMTQPTLLQPAGWLPIAGGLGGLAPNQSSSSNVGRRRWMVILLCLLSRSLSCSSMLRSRSSDTCTAVEYQIERNVQE